MKKTALLLSCFFLAFGVKAQELPKKWELKLGYEQPVFIKTAKTNCETFRPSPRGVSVRGLYEVWQNRLSLGVALGYNESNYVCEDLLVAQVDSAGYIYNIMDKFHTSQMYQRYYADAVIRFNAIYRNGFLFSVIASGGYQYINHKQTDFSIIGPIGQDQYYRTTLTEIGSNYNIMFGAETGYEIVSNLLVTAEYKFDLRNSMHLLGLGVNLKL